MSSLPAGDLIELAEGGISVTVDTIRGGEIICVVQSSGVLHELRAANLPGARPRESGRGFLSQVDFEALEFACQ